MSPEEYKSQSPEIEKSLDEAVSNMEVAILTKNGHDGFQNQNDTQNFLYEQFKLNFPDNPKADDFFSSISWDHDELCILNVCRFAKIDRRPNVESFYFTDWNSTMFKHALRQFLMPND